MGSFTNPREPSERSAAISGLRGAAPLYGGTNCARRARQGRGAAHLPDHAIEIFAFGQRQGQHEAAEQTLRQRRGLRFGF
jgi:hypothetical protein